VEKFDPSPDGWTEEEQVDVAEWRWMSSDDLASDEFECEPPHLPELVRANAPPH
jgi:hypothetical protein